YFTGVVLLTGQGLSACNQQAGELCENACIDAACIALKTFENYDGKPVGALSPPTVPYGSSGN
ncbi:MAG: hypothetical protein MHM6MM_008390, partial [Cercozoa sp. M6MM]